VLVCVGWVMFKVASLTKTCDACPAQWEGRTDKGEDVYIRYRWGSLRVDVSGATVLLLNSGDAFAGWMEFEELQQLSSPVLDLRSVEPPQ
jgi:hypothetical protein